MKTFQNGNIYLQGMDNMSSVILTVTMTKMRAVRMSATMLSFLQASFQIYATIFLIPTSIGAVLPTKKKKLCGLCLTQLLRAVRAM